MKESYELETRRKIYELLSKNPGLHLSKIAKLLNIRISLAEYHLIYLEKNKMVNVLKEGGYKRYYVISDEIGYKDKKALGILRQETPLKIVLYLLKNPNSSHKEILKMLDIAPSTLSYYLKKLIKSGIIIASGSWRDVGYTVVDEKEINRILIQYKPYKVIESFKDIWSDFTVE